MIDVNKYKAERRAYSKAWYAKRKAASIEALAKGREIAAQKQFARWREYQIAWFIASFNPYDRDLETWTNRTNAYTDDQIRDFMLKEHIRTGKVIWDLSL